MSLISDKSEGLTNVQVKVHTYNKSKLEVVFGKKSMMCNLDNNKINLSVLFNNTHLQFIIDLSKGKFIGFSKKSKNELILNQSAKPFIYD